MQHHAYVIEAEAGTGVALAHAWIERELGMNAKGNPDVIAFSFGLFSVYDARMVVEAAARAPVAGDKKAVVISAARAYHEAQNALLKLFEEPPDGTHLFLVLPNAGMLLPTLRSRVQVLAGESMDAPGVNEAAAAFIRGGEAARSAVVKRLSTGRDDDERRARRDEALALINGIEAAAYARFQNERGGSAAAFLSELSTLRGYMYDRSAPVKMILEHLAIVTPKS